jgi:hypothetical protein
MAYNQLTASVNLNTPTFIQSYLAIFSQQLNLQAEGISFVLISLILLLCAIFLIKDVWLIHECMAFVQLVQIIGLSRVRPFPFQFDFYNTLLGFSYYELSFVPNEFGLAFPNSYSETSLASAAYSYGSQNFILNFGSIFLIYLPLQLLLFAYYAYFYKNEEKVQRYKLVQETLIVLWSTIMLFGSALCVLSTMNNSISSSNLAYAFSVLIAFAFLVGYCLYYVIYVKNHLST